MAGRSPELTRYLAAFEASIVGGKSATREAHEAAGRIFGALRAATGGQTPAEPVRLPVCSHLERALGEASNGPEIAKELASAFAALEPALQWGRRAGSETQGASFANGHANAMIVGPRGLEQRDDVWIGVSLLAPGVTYPDHQHPPEEVYTVLSDGDWRRAGTDWFAPGLGGIVYNSPGIVHAMRSGGKPLFATWCLWAG